MGREWITESSERDLIDNHVISIGHINTFGKDETK